MTRCLVTGGAGFVGAPVVEHLIGAGHTVVVIDNFVRGRRHAIPKAAIVVEGDIRDSALVECAIATHRPDAVIHLAALHFIPDCDRDPVTTMEINTEATRRLGALVKDYDVSRLVFASTAAVYEPSDQPHAETDPLGPIDVYGRSKAAAEELLTQTVERPRVAIARLFNVFGPGETNRHVIPEVLDQARAGDTVRLGRTDTTRDYVFVADVARALCELATMEKPPTVVNVGSGAGSTVVDVVATIGDALGCELRIASDASRVRPVDRPHLVADPSLLAAVMPWKPATLAEGIRRIIPL